MSEGIKITDKKAEAKSQNLATRKQKANSPKSRSSPVERVLFLQKTLGNQAVQRLIESGALQTKLRMGMPGDIYEQEAARPFIARELASASIQSKEKGEDRDDEVKIKHKPTISISIVQSDLPTMIGVDGKRQACPAAAPAPQRHRELNSTAAQIAAMGACTWGITAPDNLGIRTRTCMDGANWRLVITQVNSVIRTHSRLLPGQAEPVPDVNTTAANFCNQVTELDALGDCAGAWYMIRAVRAHEDVHIDEWRDNFNIDWAPLETAIEALTVPAAGATADRAAATTSLRGTAVFTNALDTSNAGGNFPTFWGIPDPNANTDAAERAIVNPRIRWICRQARWQGWNPAGCPICVTIGIT